ncbi:MAG: IS4 family transposase [Chitinophagaceae bacterium]
MEGAVYFIDSTTIDLGLKTFRWVRFRKHKGAVKLHTMLNLQGSLPTFIYITNGKVHDVNVPDEIEFEAGSFYVMDKGYVDFSRLYKIKETGEFFLVRAKDNLNFKRITSTKVDKSAGVIVDQQIQLLGYYTSKYYPETLRRIKFYAETQNTFVFSTDNFKLYAVEIAELYKDRWDIEPFFKWIKQHLKVLKFWEYSENSVKTQIWIAISTYVLVAIIKKRLNIKHSLNEILQILSESVLVKMPVQQLFERIEIQNGNSDFPNQLKIF